jgi:hypothetical protein
MGLWITGRLHDLAEFITVKMGGPSDDNGNWRAAGFLYPIRRSHRHVSPPYRIAIGDTHGATIGDPWEEYMAKAWINSVQGSGQLTVFAGPGFTGGMWATVLKDAIVAFNNLMTAKGVKLKLATTTKKPSESGGADINLEAVASKASFSYGGMEDSRKFDGNGLHGSTVLVEIANSNKSSGIEKAFVFVPQTPRKATKGREVGAKVREFILVHEFVHAAGLSNADHTSEDVLCSPAELHEGRIPADDRLHPWGVPDGNMPPYVLSNKTVKKLQSVWP